MFVCVTLTRSGLVLLPFVGFPGRRERVRKGFHVSSFFQVVIGCGGFAHETPSKSWFIGIATLGVFIGWWTINLTFIRFCKFFG